MSRIKKWWKSPRIKSIRRKLFDLQVLFFPVLGGIMRLWVWFVQKGVTYEIRGPISQFISQKRPCIIALWHQSVFPLMFELWRYTPEYPTLFMVSKGRIGTVGAYFLSMYGIECVSTAIGKKDAVYELADCANKTGKSVFIMSDGSKGPSREAKWGAIYLARETGLPIIAAHAWGNCLITLKKTWMKLVLPKPWGRSIILSADPMVVPKTDDKQILESNRKELENRLNSTADALTAYFDEGISLDGWGSPSQRSLKL
jgi:lysophospholipid acyltransferase (LPLAT)-like uncharacterized protein